MDIVVLLHFRSTVLFFLIILTFQLYCFFYCFLSLFIFGSSMIICSYSSFHGFHVFLVVMVAYCVRIFNVCVIIVFVALIIIILGLVCLVLSVLSSLPWLLWLRSSSSSCSLYGCRILLLVLSCPFLVFPMLDLLIGFFICFVVVIMSLSRCML